VLSAFDGSEMFYAEQFFLISLGSSSLEEGLRMSTDREAGVF
jgi:hypothetical protein